MNDRVIGLLGRYDIEVLRTRKGRGAVLCDSNRGTLIFKEYQGQKGKIGVQDRLLKKIAESGLLVEEIIPAREGELSVQDTDGVSYILKTYFEGRECNVQDLQECIRGVKTLARLHGQMRLEDPEALEQMPVYRPEKEYAKHNKELKKIRRFLRQKSQKNDFEIYLLQEYDYFFDQAQEVAAEWNEFLLPEDGQLLKKNGVLCHGDYQYHNIIETPGGQAVINFEKFLIDDQIRDLYLFMRKLLEKSNWSRELGSQLVRAYCAVNPLPARSYVALYYRLAYPEKFWKIVNFYYNSGKSWIPEKNMEKLQKIVGQEREKQKFLDAVFRTV